MKLASLFCVSAVAALTACGADRNASAPSSTSAAVEGDLDLSALTENASRFMRAPTAQRASDGMSYVWSEAGTQNDRQLLIRVDAIAVGAAVTTIVIGSKGYTNTTRSTFPSW